MTKKLCSVCTKAEEKSGINISRLLEKLKVIKGKELSDYERTYLCLSLALYNNAQIAYFMYKHELVELEKAYAHEDIKRMIRNMNSEMSQERSVNFCMKKLMNLENRDRRPSWALVINFLKSNGFGNNQKLLKKNTAKSSLVIEGNVTAEQIRKIFHDYGITNVKIQESN